MIQRDVLLRQIQQLTHALVRIAEMVTNREFDRALEAIDEQLNMQLDGSAEGLRRIPPERLLALCHENGRFSAQAAQTLARLLRLQGDAHAGRDEDAAAGACYGRALLLLRAALQSDDATVSWKIGTHLAELKRLTDEHPPGDDVTGALQELGGTG